MIVVHVSLRGCEYMLFIYYCKNIIYQHVSNAIKCSRCSFCGIMVLDVFYFFFLGGGHPSRQVFHVFPGCIKIQVTKSPLQLLVELIASPGIPETFWWKHQVQGIDIALTYGAGELVTRLFTARQANLSPLQVQNLKHTIHLVYIYMLPNLPHGQRDAWFFLRRIPSSPTLGHT